MSTNVYAGINDQQLIAKDELSTPIKERVQECCLGLVTSE